MQRCGLCSIISSLLRRAMCVGSRRGSGESYYHELAETTVPDVATMDTSDSYIRLIPTTTTTQTTTTITVTIPRRLSDSDKDRPLFEALMNDENSENPRRRHACNGRFLTMHKRRRKKLNTRSLGAEPGILDDVLHGQVQCILSKVGNWRFNAFTLETVTGGRSLPVLCVHLFHWYGLLDYYNLDVVRLWKLFSLIEEGYHSTNPYHNSIHATDVTQAMHCFLQEKLILENLTPLEIMASLIGAVTHDLDHPGVNQPFLIATSNHLAALYENTSVLENHHWRSAVGCLLESGVAEQIQDIRPELEKQISSLILATDITRQQEFINQFREYLSTDTLDMRDKSHRHFILQIALKCADISNPCRPWDISKKWSQKVCEEFYRQGDYERQLNLPVTSLCDRQTTSVPKIQTGFFKFVVTPLLNEWHRFLKTDLSYNMMGHLKFNQIQWESRLQTEIAEETRTEISDAEILDDDLDDVDDEPIDSIIDLSDSSEVLLPNLLKHPRRSSLQVTSIASKLNERRLSVPIHCIPKIILPPREYVAPDSFQESDEHKMDNDSISICSSDDSDSLHRGARGSSTGSTADKERPLSAENLLPDCSIASMTDGVCANRLNMVLHGAASVGNTTNLLTVGTSKQLIRQQTFPPLQPYVRARYMSSQAELGACPEALLESNSSSSSNSNGELSESRNYYSNNRKKDSFKREQDVGEKANKLLKLTIPGQKENMDPSMLKRSLSRRRGSAPVTVALPPKTNESDVSVSFVMKTCELMRRSSVPTEMLSYATVDEENSTLPNNITASHVLAQRRESAPCDTGNVSFRNKRRSAKKILRRRSSGGPEILSPILPEGSNGSSAWSKFIKRDLTRKSENENLLSRRRGSLPVEVLVIGNSGTLRH